ncbi:MAG: hypothetical protein M3433_00070 [Actinomycetota bacterium]|nr:hypothetical protein [Actinomycetota bacterium]
MRDDNDAIVDGSATEIAATDVDQEPDDGNVAGERKAGGLVLTRAPAGREVLMPLEADQVVEGMRVYQDLLRRLLEASDWQTHDKNGNPLDRPFLKKCGWRKIARAFNLSFERVHSRVEREDDGTPMRAEVWIRAVAPNGQYGDGDGYCSADEVRFKSWRGRQKLENDLRATATTRAKNRSIADLVGMGEVSAEEIEPGGAAPPTDTASDELAKVTYAALRRLLGSREAARRAGERIAADLGYLPVAVGRAICHVASELAGEPASDDSRAEAESDKDVSKGPKGVADGGQPESHAFERAEDDEPRRAKGQGQRPVGPRSMPSAARATAGGQVQSPTGLEAVAHWQHKGRYPDGVVRSLAQLVCGQGELEQLTPEQAAEVAFLVECGVRGKVSGRTLEGWLTKLAGVEDRRAAAEALRGRLIEKVDEVELVGRREAA